MTAKKIGEVLAETGATWEVHASLAGVTMAGGAPISPSDASALARLLLDAAEVSRVMRLRASSRATMRGVEGIDWTMDRACDACGADDPTTRRTRHDEQWLCLDCARPRLVPERPKRTCAEHGLVIRDDDTCGAGCTCTP